MLSKMLAILIGLSLSSFPLMANPGLSETTVPSSREIGVTSDSEDVTAKVEDDQAEVSDLVSLFKKMPASAANTGIISYLDLEAYMASYPYISWPASAEEANELLQSPDLASYRPAFMGIGSGYQQLFRFMAQAPDMQEVSGLNPYQVRQSVSLELAPNTQFWLRGYFNRETIIDALTDQEYEATSGSLSESNEDEWLLLCEGGNCGDGLEIDMEKRNPGFIYGGDLGRRWPVMLLEDIVVSTTAASSIRSILSSSGASLIDQAAISYPIEAVENLIINDQEAAITQLLIMKPEFVFGGEIRSNAERFALFQTNGELAQRVIVSQFFPTFEDAEKAYESLRESIPEDESLSSLIQSLGGEMEDLFLESSEAGAVVVLPIRFATPADILADDGTITQPFNAFTRMIMSYKMDWFNPSDAN